jgi:hypothetical protein
MILVGIAGYDGIVRLTLLHDYNRRVQEFQAKEPLLQKAFPLDFPQIVTTKEYEILPPNKSISNVHEAEVILRNLGCDDLSVQRATARFLSASTPEYENKTLRFSVGRSGGKGGDCSPKDIKDIFDQLATNASPPKTDPYTAYGGKASAATAARVPAPPPGFTEDVPLANDSGKFRAAAKNASPKVRWDDEIDQEIGFEFQIRDSDAARQFFTPLPDWHTEALEHKIEVGRVPDWMKPGQPPAPLAFVDWLDSRSPWLILAAGMLALGVLCLVAASRITKASAA